MVKRLSENVGDFEGEFKVILQILMDSEGKLRVAVEKPEGMGWGDWMVNVVVSTIGGIHVETGLHKEMLMAEFLQKLGVWKK